MALATRCPHCKTTFRVAADQLKLRGGIVRCGTCSQVFDGNAALVELDSIKPRAPLVPVVPVEEQGDLGGHTIMAQELTEVETPAPAAPLKPTYVLDYDLSEPTPVDYDLSEPEGWSAPAHKDAAADQDTVATAPQPTLPESAGSPEVESAPAPVPEPEADTSPDPEPSLELELDPAVLEQHVPAPPPPEEPEDWPSPHELEHPHHPDLDIGPLPLVRESAPAAEEEIASAPAIPEPARQVRQVRHETLAPPPPDHDEPQFVRLHREKELNARRRQLTFAVASLVLLLVLLAQVVSNFRNTLAAQYPGLKPALGAACKVLGCTITLPTQIEQLSIETGELQSLSPTSFQLTTLLSNKGSLVQAWPHIELELTDAADKAVVRRVFTPAQYLPNPGLAAKGFAGKSEQPVRIQFELKQVKASGFHIAVFYP